MIARPPYEAWTPSSNLSFRSVSLPGPRLRWPRLSGQDLILRAGTFIVPFLRKQTYTGHARELTVAGRLSAERLACGSQAFIATLLFDPSMSALPIIEMQKS